MHDGLRDQGRRTETSLLQSCRLGYSAAVYVGGGTVAAAMAAAHNRAEPITWGKCGNATILLDEHSDASREILHGRHVCLGGFITDSGMDESRSYSDGGLSMCSVAMQSPSPSPPAVGAAVVGLSYSVLAYVHSRMLLLLLLVLFSFLLRNRWKVLSPRRP